MYFDNSRITVDLSLHWPHVSPAMRLSLEAAAPILAELGVGSLRQREADADRSVECCSQTNRVRGSRLVGAPRQPSGCRLPLAGR